jgi:hypothetical protein
MSLNFRILVPSSQAVQTASFPKLSSKQNTIVDAKKTTHDNIKFMT